MKKLNLCIKRLLDLFCSLTGLVLLSPILLIIAVLIKLTSKGPVFFRQRTVRKGRKSL
jgi:O-antigen biosynthesis protein WbqP